MHANQKDKQTYLKAGLVSKNKVDVIAVLCPPYSLQNIGWPGQHRTVGSWGPSARVKPFVPFAQREIVSGTKGVD